MTSKPKQRKRATLTEREKKVFLFAFNAGSYFGCEHYECDQTKELENYCAKSIMNASAHGKLGKGR